MREIGTARQMNARALRTLSGNMLLSLSTALFPPRGAFCSEKIPTSILQGCERANLFSV
jgi:hypothetical protein